MKRLANPFQNLVNAGIMNAYDYSVPLNHIRDNGLVFRALKVEDAAQASKVIDDIFYKEEPICVLSGLKQHDLAKCLAPAINSILEQNLSTGLFDKDNKLVSLGFGYDLASYPEFGPPSPELEHIFNFLDQLSIPYKGGRKFKKGEVYYNFLRATVKEHQHKGLAVYLCAEIVANCVSRGYQEYYGHSTNPVSVIINKAVMKNLEINHYISYMDYVDIHGKNPFKGAPGGSSACVGRLTAPK